jgi:hypothetical protein
MQKLQRKILKNPRSPETVKTVIHPTCNTKTRHLYPTINKARPKIRRTTKKGKREIGETTVMQRHSSIRYSHILILTTILTLKN